MDYPRQLPLFDAEHGRGTWNERMTPGEFAVHYSSLEGNAIIGVHCTVFGGLKEAVAYAREQAGKRPSLCCTIYDHQGFIGAPLQEIRGTEFKANEISARFRRWAGSIFFFGGVILIAVDWIHDFRLSWPAMIGTRMLIFGLILLFTEAMVVLHARLNRRHSAERESA